MKTSGIPQKKEKAAAPQMEETMKDPVRDRGKSRSPRKRDSPENSNPTPANPHQHFLVQRYSEAITMGWQMPMIKNVVRPMTRPTNVMCMMRKVCLTKVTITHYGRGGEKERAGNSPTRS
jgi:hypothetical protein